MRRGLMSWSRDEVPAAVLDGRVGRLQIAMRETGLRAVLAYTSFAQPAVVHWLTNFTPYWSEALLVVWPEGPPVLLAALTPRVHGWIREVSHLGDVVSAPKLGAAAVALLADRVAADGRIGVVGLDTLPWSVGEPLLQARGGALVDALPLYRGVRQPSDATERALAAHAQAIALQALRALPPDAVDTSTAAAAMEASARDAGAEEVLHRVAPDLDANAALLRLEGRHVLGRRYAVELSVAYKGTWVRAGRGVARDAAPAWWSAAQAWFDRASSDLPALLAGAVTPPPDVQASWTLESSITAQPLTAIATDRCATTTPPAVGSLTVLSATLRHASGQAWFHAAALVTHAHGTRRLGQETENR